MQAQSQQVGPGGPAHRSVAAGRGVNWWTEAWPWMFDGGRAGIWIGMGLVTMLIYVGLHFVPVLGPIAAHLLLFPLAGGLILAARKSERGETPEFADLFSGFGTHAGALLLAGVLIIAASLLVVGLMAMVGVGAAVSAFLGGLDLDLGSRPVAAAGLGIATALLLVVCLALFIPISMAAWFAPALIVLRGAQPVDALKSSLAACRANIGALVVYGLLFIAFALLASMLLGLGWLVLTPMAALSTYGAYKDVLEPEVDIQL
ncbi:MAG TPA: BPSS1780 family membrane protein [Burkholderiaceae bacterium]